MSLGKKTLALFLVLGLSICLGGYVTLRVTVLPAFDEFEHQASEEALARVTRLLESDLRALSIMNIEYSSWTDTYEYALGVNPEFKDENLDPAYWHSVSINMMLIFDKEGKPLFGRIGDPSDGRRLDLTDEFLASLRPGHPLITHDTLSSSVSGLILTPVGVMQLTSYPILSSEGAGPAAGAFVVGQFITDGRIAELGERATVELSFHAIGDESLPAPVVAALRNGKSDATVATYAETVHGFQVLPDALGQPAVVLEVQQPRTITEIGIGTIRTAMTFVAVGSIGFLLAALFFLQRLIVTPIKVLTEKILDIRHTGNLNTDVGTNRSDEVGVLAKEFGELAFSLNNARSQLEGARDEAISVSQAKSEFLARMSHEIRTPMNGVLGMTELLRNTALDEKQQRFAGTIYESAESLLHIINDILDISKIEAGKIELDIAPFNLRTVVEECLDLLAETAHRKDLELVGVIPPDTHTFVEGDALRLRQVLVNLLSNAVKFTERGEIIVRVSELRNDAETVEFRIDVEDTGIGIKPENVEKVFEPFSQEDGSTTRRYGGTGLGLSICRQLLDLMGGDIGAESTPGHGCTFWFSVRLKKDVTTPQLMQQEILPGKRILIVDDNATNRESLRHQLEDWDMLVDEACSGPEALGLMSSAAHSDAFYELVLLDMNMPDMDGVQLAKAIRQSDWAGAVPLVMLSSVSGADVSEDRVDAGIDAWLTKPVRQTRLYDALVSHLSRAAGNSGHFEISGESIDAVNDDASRNLRILLAEDNPVNQLVAIGMLNELGHETTVVADGNEAVAKFKEQGFDLVFMDCQMPELDGYMATQAIRDWEADQDRAPTAIIALTANALSGDRDRCLDAGMSDYVSKPFTLEKLGAVISRNIQPSADADAVADDQSDSNARVLIVDDNTINQQVTKAMLDELGYDSGVASNGNEALRALRLTQFDLVLMDCHMPIRNGYDTTREIRRLEEQSSSNTRIPIVALTADLMQNNRQRCLECGMDDYVSKPFTGEQLRVVLKRWLADPDTEELEAKLVIDADGFSELTETVTLASIDRLALEQIIQLDSSPGKNLVREIVVSYCADSTKLMLQLRSAIADGDAREIEVLAHSLKGSSGQIGATLLAALCEQLISGARNNDLSDASTLCERAAAEHSAVMTALDAELQRMAA
jgi:CheY-like chemotaxis protein/signal transduction histidine kinase/HPt (histidine-containing phosphotransfer) domain-containing protein